MAFGDVGRKTLRNPQKKRHPYEPSESYSILEPLLFFSISSKVRSEIKRFLAQANSKYSAYKTKCANNSLAILHKLIFTTSLSKFEVGPKWKLQMQAINPGSLIASMYFAVDPSSLHCVQTRQKKKSLKPPGIIIFLF